MAANYNKLWKLLIDKGMKKKDLQLAAGISSGVITKMGKGEPLFLPRYAKPWIVTSATLWNSSTTKNELLEGDCYV